MKNMALILSFLVTGAVVSFGWMDSARADYTSHIIINEIQVAGENSNDEFVELFNPGDTPIDLERYKLTKKTKTGSTESTLVSTSKFSGLIGAHGYFLISHPDYGESIDADLIYSGSSYYISSDNTVLLYNENGDLLDKVGFGAASDFETTSAPNPDGGQSIERTDFIDTDNNLVDFSVNIFPTPKNSGVIEGDSEEPANDEPAETEDTENDSESSSDDSNFCTAESLNVKINEIFPYPASGDEFVEVSNFGETCVDISGWKIMDGAGHKKEFPYNSILEPGEYLFLEGNLYLNNDSDTVYLLGRDGSGKDDALDSQNFEKAQKDFSYSFEGEGWQWTSTASPGNKNIFDGDTDSSENNGIAGENEIIGDGSPAENVFLNEILPNPGKNSEEEYIEIKNDESGLIDLFGWKIKDASRGKGYEFKDHVLIESGKYFVIYKSESKISLNNSKESVYLFNSRGDMVSSVSYDKSKNNSSYNFDEENWHWSKYLTPGEKNKFDSEPSVKIKKIKRAYKNVLTNFSAKVKDKETKKGKLKYSWDFGDGGKSTLAKPAHKYLETGKYAITLSVSDDSQTVEKSFNLAVKEYPHPDVEVVRVNPNPPGKDAGSETIDLKNSSDKKVSLDGWKIATGSGENIYSHPIKDGVDLSPKETKTIDQEISKFVLNNKSDRVRLISPDGETVDEVEYEKEKIAEGEVYVKTDVEWKWIMLPTEIFEQENNSSEKITEESEIKGKVLGESDGNVSRHTLIQTGYTSEDAYIFFKSVGFFEYKSQEIIYCSKNNTVDVPLIISSIYI